MDQQQSGNKHWWSVRRHETGAGLLGSLKSQKYRCQEVHQGAMACFLRKRPTHRLGGGGDARNSWTRNDFKESVGCSLSRSVSLFYMLHPVPSLQYTERALMLREHKRSAGDYLTFLCSMCRARFIACSLGKKTLQTIVYNKEKKLLIWVQ